METYEEQKQLNFLENAFKLANEKISLFEQSFADNHFRWLEEIYEEAKKAFTSEDVVWMLPKTPSMKRKRKRAVNTRKTSKAASQKVPSIDNEKPCSPSNKRTSRASKRVKVANDLTDASTLDTSNILDESNTHACGRQLRPRRAKNGKPPLPKRQNKKKASKCEAPKDVKINNDVQISPSPSFQKVRIEMKYEQNHVYSFKTPERKQINFADSPTSEKNKNKDAEIAHFESSSAKRYAGSSQLFSPHTPDSSHAKTPTRFVSTPNSLQPKVAAIIKQFTDFEASANMSPSPQKPKQKKPGRLSNKYKKYRRSSVLSSARKAKQFSKRKSSVNKWKTKDEVDGGTRHKILGDSVQSDEQDNYHNKEVDMDICLSKSQSADLQFSEEDGKRDLSSQSTHTEMPEREFKKDQDSGISSMFSSAEETANISKQQRKTYDIATASDSHPQVVLTIEPESLGVDERNSRVDEETENGSVIVCSDAQSIKRKTYDLTASSTGLQTIDICLDENETLEALTPNHVYESKSATKATIITKGCDETIEIQPPSTVENDESKREKEHVDLTLDKLDKDSFDDAGTLETKDNTDSIKKENLESVYSLSPSVVNDTPPGNGPKIVKSIKAGNVLSHVITSFIRKNTSKTGAVEDKKKLKADMLKKEKIRQKNLGMLEIKRKQEMEERKRRREERERRVAEIQALRAQEEKEKKRALQERMEKVRDKEEKAKKLKEKEEEIKKKAREKKQAEVEARRRQEEEERKQKILELELEEKRKQEYLAKKAEYEEQFRTKRAADLKRLEEQKLQEMEHERKLQGERWRREIEEKTKKREEAERKAKEEKEKERCRKDEEKEKRAKAAEMDRKLELENQRTIFRQQLVLKDLEEKERKIAEIKEKYMRAEKERKEWEEKERREREAIRKEKEGYYKQYMSAEEKKVLSEKKNKETDILNVVGRVLEDYKTTSKTTVAPPVLQQSNSLLNHAAVLPQHEKSGVSVMPLKQETSGFPVPQLAPRESSYVTYDIADMESDDSTDDDEDPMHKVPSWAQKQPVMRALRHPEYKLLDPDRIFVGLLMPPKLEEIFTKHTARFFKRTSSACWDSPILKNGRKIV